MGHASAGAWINYGLGTENQNVPGYVVLRSGDSGVPHGGVTQWSSGYLSAEHQATQVHLDQQEPISTSGRANRRTYNGSGWI